MREVGPEDQSCVRENELCRYRSDPSGRGADRAGRETLTLTTLEPFLVVAGFLVVGLALLAVVPVAFSVAGDLAPVRVGGAISVVMTLGCGGFLSSAGSRRSSAYGRPSGQ